MMCCDEIVLVVVFLVALFERNGNEASFGGAIEHRGSVTYHLVSPF
jgi:hypothetical protein